MFRGGTVFKSYILKQKDKLLRSSPWWQVALLLGVLLWVVPPPAPLVVMPPAQSVQTAHALVGVHTRLTDEVETWKIQRSLALVREMGAPWIVEYFPWAYIEASPGQYDWTHSDSVIAHARNQGLVIIARLGMVPSWARPDPQVQATTPTYLDLAYYTDFARFVGAFVHRYQGQVHYVIIWNEPNLSFEWGFRTVDPAAYVALLREVYPVAHQANPNITVLAGALAPTIEPSGSPAGLNDIVYLEQMYQVGAANYLDALAVHTYGLNSPPAATPSPLEINFRRVELLRAVMVTYGDADKQIFITESGWNDHPRWVWGVTPLQREVYTLAAYDWAEQHWPWCSALVMWMFRTPVALHNYQDAYAFVTHDFQRRPIYHVMQRYTGNVTE